jgi:hypothetical protein
VVFGFGEEVRDSEAGVEEDGVAAAVASSAAVFWSPEAIELLFPVRSRVWCALFRWRELEG